MDYWEHFGNPLDLKYDTFTPSYRTSRTVAVISRRKYTFEEVMQMIRQKMPLCPLDWLIIPKTSKEDLRAIIAALDSENIVHVYGGRYLKLPFRVMTYLSSKNYYIYSDQVQFVAVSKSFSELPRKFDSLRDLLWIIPDATIIGGHCIRY
jgi:hypothetical protein